jgi:hypothetical protein
MDIGEVLLVEHSRTQTDLVIDYIGNSKNRYRDLWEIIKTGEPPLPQRAAWVLDGVTLKYPELFNDIFDEAVTFLPHENHDAVHRALAKILGLRDTIPEKHQGILFSLAIDWMMSPTKAVAIKVHCMSMACTIAMPIPELREELALVIKDQMDLNTVGFRSRGNKILKKLSRAR